jgi:TonB family protein
MKLSRVVLIPSLLLLGLGGPLFSQETAAPAKPTYTVVVELKVSEDGVPSEMKIVSTNDTTAEHVLDREALKKAAALKLAPQIKDGKAVAYKARAPFAFVVEGDEGPGDPQAVKPRIKWASQPVYPPDMAAAGELGGAILEALIGTDGQVHGLKVIRSTNPEIADAAVAAVKDWVFVAAPAGTPPGVSRWNLSICFENEERAMDWAWRVAPRPSLGNYTVVHVMHPPAAAK